MPSNVIKLYFSPYQLIFRFFDTSRPHQEDSIVKLWIIDSQNFWALKKDNDSVINPKSGKTTQVTPVRFSVKTWPE
jgi:hypothetical protein